MSLLFMKGKIVITGAGGFIGSHLVDLLLTKYPASSLRLIVSKKDKLKNLPQKKLDIVRGDIRDKKFIKKALTDATVIYHLASYTGFESENYSDFKKVNVDTTEYMLEVCKNKKLQKFVFFSTIAVYGLPAWIGNIHNYDEKTPYNPTEKYGRSKMEAEKKIFEAHRKWKIPFTIIRPVSVYGPRDAGQIFSLYQSIKNNKFIFIGDGKNKMHYIYVTDLVKGAYLAQISKKAASDYILAGSSPTNFNDVVKYIAKSIQKKPFPLHIPEFLGLILGYFGEIFEKVTSIRSPIFRTRVRVMTTDWYYSISKAKKELKFQPKISFAEGASLTGKWLIANKKI